MGMSLTERISRASARRPKTVIAIWLLAVIGAIGINGALLSDALTTDINFLSNPDSKVGRDLIQDSSLQGDSFSETVVVQHPDLTVDDPAFRARVQSLTTSVLGVESVEGATNVYRSGNQGLVSTDRHTTIIPVAIPPELKDDVTQTLEIVDAADGAGGFTVVESGLASLDHDFNTAAEEDLQKGETIGIAFALVILLVVFGSIVASLVPIVLAVVAIIVGLAIAALVGQVVELSFFVTNMMTMMGLAVGIDYSLFIVSRFREERARGREKIDAIGFAGATASKAVLFSGLTVVLALAGLLLVPNTIFGSLGAGAIIVVVVAVVLALTLLPAALSLLGDRVNALRIPLLKGSVGAEAAASPLWSGIARGVMRRPVVSLVAATALLLVCAAPLLTISTGFSGVSSLPDGFESKRGFLILEQKFNAGQSSPAQIVISGTDLAGAEIRRDVQELSAAIEANDAFGSPQPLQISDDGRVGIVQAPLASDPSGEESYAAVRELRDEMVPAAFAGSGAKVVVAGKSAEDIDFIDQLSRYTPIVIAFVLILSFILLLIAFRSIVIPLTSILVNLLSVGAAYGLMVLVIQKGYGNEIFGFAQVDQIEPWIPLFLFAVLFGLSMDYQVFLVSRIQERWNETRDNREAVAWGVGTTARLITGAALIMVSVFAGFAAGQLTSFQQMGFGLAIAILVDATIVRTVLVPAAMTLLGRWNWYLPRSLGWIPNVSIEGPRTPVASGGLMSGTRRR